MGAARGRKGGGVCSPPGTGTGQYRENVIFNSEWSDKNLNFIWLGNSIVTLPEVTTFLPHSFIFRNIIYLPYF